MTGQHYVYIVWRVDLEPLERHILTTKPSKYEAIHHASVFSFPVEIERWAHGDNKGHIVWRN